MRLRAFAARIAAIFLNTEDLLRLFENLMRMGYSVVVLGAFVTGGDGDSEAWVFVESDDMPTLKVQIHPAPSNPFLPNYFFVHSFDSFQRCIQNTTVTTARSTAGPQ